MNTLLQRAYDADKQNDGDYLYKYSSKEFNNELFDEAVEYLKKADYIILYGGSPPVDNNYLRITPKGIDYVENGFSSYPNPQITGNNNIIVAGSNNIVSDNFNTLIANIYTSDLPEEYKQPLADFIQELKKANLSNTDLKSRLKAFAQKMGENAVLEVISYLVPVFLKKFL